MAGSSSITRTRNFCWFIRHLHRRRFPGKPRKRKAEYRAAFRTPLRPNPAAVRLDKTFADRQAETSALLHGGSRLPPEPLENSADFARWNSDAAVSHQNLQILLGRPRLNANGFLGRRVL